MKSFPPRLQPKLPLLLASHQDRILRRWRFSDLEQKAFLSAAVGASRYLNIFLSILHCFNSAIFEISRNKLPFVEVGYYLKWRGKSTCTKLLFRKSCTASTRAIFENALDFDRFGTSCTK